MGYKTVYKVIKRETRKSACIKGEAAVTYPVGEIVKSKVRNAPLMAFESKEDARRFVDKLIFDMGGHFGNNLKIVKCKARVSRRVRWPTMLSGTAYETYDINELEQCWLLEQDWSNKKYWSNKPEIWYNGTVYCSQIIPLE